MKNNIKPLYVTITAPKSRQQINPVILLKEILGNISLDQESFDEVELYCYRNKIYTNTYLSQKMIDIILDLLKGFNGYLACRKDKLYLYMN